MMTMTMTMTIIMLMVVPIGESAKGAKGKNPDALKVDKT